MKPQGFAYAKQRYLLLQMNNPKEAKRMMALAKGSPLETYEHLSKQDPSGCQPTM